MISKINTGRVRPYNNYSKNTTTIGACLRLELKQKGSYTDEENKDIRTNQMKTIFCGNVGAILTVLYLII